jgi:hypothetical protein
VVGREGFGFSGETGLADAGLAEDDDRSSLTVASGNDGLLEQLSLPRAPHESRRQELP